MPTAIRPETFRHAGRLERLAGTANDYQSDGGREWELVCELWCSIEPATPAEQLEAAQRKVIITHKIKTHWRPELFVPGNHTFRVIVGRRRFAVVGIVDASERRRVAELTCTEKS